jgi:hypothetical protein
MEGTVHPPAPRSLELVVVAAAAAALLTTLTPLTILCDHAVGEQEGEEGVR